jgi:invasion protein IalB
MRRRDFLRSFFLLAIIHLEYGAGASAQTVAEVVLPRAAPPTSEVSVVYSPWAKVCDKNAAQSAVKEICLTISEAYLQSGQFFGSAALIEVDGDPVKRLRIMMPLGVSLAQGSRLIIDKGEPITQPFRVCFPNGCMAEYEVSNDRVSQIRDGQTVAIESIDSGTQKPVYLVLPLDGFAHARDGAPISPAALEERQKKFRDQTGAQNKSSNLGKSAPTK